MRGQLQRVPVRRRAASHSSLGIRSPAGGPDRQRGLIRGITAGADARMPRLHGDHERRQTLADAGMLAFVRRSAVERGPVVRELVELSQAQ
jgi:hypothetical protein